MNDDQLSRFTFQSDDDAANALIEDAPPISVVNNKLFDKLSRRVTIITILIPCLIGVMLYYFYKDVQKKSLSISDSSTEKIISLSKEIEEKFTGFLKQQEEFQGQIKESINKNINSINNKTLLIKKDIDKIEKSLKKYGGIKADKKELKSALKKIDKSIISVQKNFKDISKKLEAIKHQHTEDMKKILNLTNFLERLQTKTALISSIKADKKIVDKSFTDERKYFKEELRKISKKVDENYASILKKINGPQVQKNNAMGIVEENIQ